METDLRRALDEEFVLARGRQGSLVARYPALFTAAARDDIFVVPHPTGPRACAIARPFVLAGNDGDWQGAMIGMVWTHPAARGLGLATQVLAEILAVQRAAGRDFAVLWSALDGFYTARGWQAADCGMLGAADLAPMAAPATGDVRAACVESVPLAGPGADAAIARVEDLRRDTPAACVARDALAWRTVPLPAAHCALHLTADAWALSGHDGDRAWLYEMAGAPAAYAALWHAVTRDTAHIVVNVADDTPACAWLRAHAPLQWQQQRLACWQALTPRAASLDFSRCYVPWFDRI